MRVKWSKTILVAIVILVFGTTPAVARPVLIGSDTVEQHCVARVEAGLDEVLETVSERCYTTLAEAIADATEGALQLPATIDGEGLAAVLDGAGYSFIIGIHYDGYNGTGSSITVVGNSCSGGWWNVPLYFSSRISSSWAGCYRLTHYDHANMGGSSYTTFGSHRLFNLYTFNNRTGSVRYAS